MVVRFVLSNLELKRMIPFRQAGLVIPSLLPWLTKPIRSDGS